MAVSGARGYSGVSGGHGARGFKATSTSISAYQPGRVCAGAERRIHSDIYLRGA